MNRPMFGLSECPDRCSMCGNEQNQQMSVYSGFATRQQEHKYNNLVETLIIAMKKRIMKFYEGEGCDEGKFKLLVKKIYKKMYFLEKGKFIAPKYTSCFTDLIDSLQIEINYDTMSQCSSMMSQTFSLRKDSVELEGDQLRSNALLNNKKNLLQVKANKIFNSTLSLSKNDIPTFQNQEEAKPWFAPRSTSLTPVENQLKHMKSNKFKLNELKNLKELRGTMNMPRVQQFLPKKEEIQPGYLNPRKNTFMEPQKGNESPGQPAAKMVFRRQKYSKAEVKAEDI